VDQAGTVNKHNASMLPAWLLQLLAFFHIYREHSIHIVEIPMWSACLSGSTKDQDDSRFGACAD
jgi:hypothetical protein